MGERERLTEEERAEMREAAAGVARGEWLAIESSRELGGVSIVLGDVFDGPGAVPGFEPFNQVHLMSVHPSPSLAAPRDIASRNARHILAAQPLRLLRLLDERDALAAELAALKAGTASRAGGDTPDDHEVDPMHTVAEMPVEQPFRGVLVGAPGYRIAELRDGAYGPAVQRVELRPGQSATVIAIGPELAEDEEPSVGDVREAASAPPRWRGRIRWQPTDPFVRKAMQLEICRLHGRPGGVPLNEEPPPALKEAHRRFAGYHLELDVEVEARADGSLRMVRVVDADAVRRGEEPSAGDVREAGR